MRGHDGDARRQEHRFLDAVRDEHDGHSLRRPQRQQLASSRWRVNSSSAPNGSSISNRSGSITSARAIDARICMPPDSCRGQMSSERASGERARARAATAARAFARGSTGKRQRKPHIRRHARPRHQGRRLEHEADAPTDAAGMRRTCRPTSAGDRSWDGQRPAINASSVDLPQPDGPTRVRNSPRRTSRSTPRSARVPVS